MAEDLKIPAGTLTREDKYVELYPQIVGLLDGESDPIANMANIASALRFGLEFFWVGFYIYNSTELVLGPFQGPPACTRIKIGKGVCGTSFGNMETIVVPDVEQFPGHIACSALSKSEVVIPFKFANGLSGVLDVDSDKLNDFTSVDSLWLNKIVELLNK